MGQPKTIAEDPLVPRPKFARAIGNKTPSIAKADKRGNGPGGAIHLEKNRVAYPTSRIVAWCAVRGLEWTGDSVRPLPKGEEATAPAAPGGAP